MAGILVQFWEPHTRAHHCLAGEAVQVGPGGTIGLPTTASRLPTPIRPETRSMPADNGVRLNDRQSITNSRKQPIEPNEYQSVYGTEGEFLWSSPPLDVDLLQQGQKLSLEHYPRPQQIDDCPANKSAKIPHPTTGLPDSRSTASRMRFATGTAGPSTLPGV